MFSNAWTNAHTDRMRVEAVQERFVERDFDKQLRNKLGCNDCRCCCCYCCHFYINWHFSLSICLCLYVVCTCVRVCVKRVLFASSFFFRLRIHVSFFYILPSPKPHQSTSRLDQIRTLIADGHIVYILLTKLNGASLNNAHC